MNERAIGRHWVTDQITDDLSPGQQPSPSTGAEGPPMSEAVVLWQQQLDAIRELGRQTAAQGFDFIAGSAQGATDSGGDAVIGIYQVAAGVEARLFRLVLNARVAASNAIYTPAVPWASASTYVMTYQADAPTLQALGEPGLLDFGPLTAGDPVFPGLFTDEDLTAPFVRGPAWIVLRVNDGPISSTVYARYQVGLRRAAGIA